MRKTKYKKNKYKIILAFVILLIFFYINFLVNPMLYKECEIRTKNAVNITIAEQINSITNSNSMYEKLVNITYSNDNKISSIQINSFEVNNLNTRIISECSNSLNSLSDNKIDIPLGCFSGIKLINNLGPNVVIRYKLNGLISTNYESSFASVGINQTRHQIILKINTQLKVLLPFYNPSISLTYQLLLAENIIVGEIPEIYLNTNSQNQLNLYP